MYLGAIYHLSYRLLVCVLINISLQFPVSEAAARHRAMHYVTIGTQRAKQGRMCGFLIQFCYLVPPSAVAAVDAKSAV